MKIIFYKLGNLNEMNPTHPTQEIVNKLKQEIEKGRKDGEMHLVWGPDLSITMIDTNNNL